MQTLLTAAAKSAVICGIALALHRKIVGGIWAAGYWWTTRDRKQGPGC